MRKSSNHKLGIDAGSFSIKSIAGKWKSSTSFSGRAGGYVLRADHDQQQAEFGDDIHHSIQPLYNKKMNIFTAVHMADVIIREIDVSSELTGYELEREIEVKLMDLLPFDVGIYLDYMQVQRSQGAHTDSTNKYIVAVSRKEIVDPIVDNIKDFDKQIKNVNVDVDAYALGRLINLLYEDQLQNELILLVDIGHESSRYYFFDNSNLLFNREQQIGGKYVTDSIAEIYDMSFAEAEQLKHRQEYDNNFNELVVKPFASTFIEQLNLVNDFFEASASSDKKLTKVVLSGGGACLDGLLPQLREQFDLPIEIVNLTPFMNESIPNGWTEQQFSAQYALSLALLVDGERK